MFQSTSRGSLSGSPAVSGVAVASGSTEEDLLARAAAVRINLRTPSRQSNGRRRQTPQPDSIGGHEFRRLPGRRAKAVVKGTSVEIGGPRLVTEASTTMPPEVEKLTTAWASDGKTVLYVLAQGRLLRAITLEDEIRPESGQAVAELHRLGVRVAMITGDSKAVLEDDV